MTVINKEKLTLEIATFLRSPFPGGPMPDPKYKPVKSSNIRALRLVGDHLEVLFLSGGRWEYFPVTMEAFATLMSAESVGKAFNAQIKSNREIESAPMPVLSDEELAPLLEAQEA